MEFITVYLALLLPLFSILILKALHRRRKLNPPPGPKTWPVIGNLDLMGTLPHRSIHELSRRYGPIMQLHFGSVPVLVGSSVDAAKLILKTMDLTFASRRRTAAGKFTAYNYADITWSPYGAYWRQARKVCATELFSARRLDEYEYIRVEEMAALLRDLYSAVGTHVVIKDMLSTVSLNVIGRMVLGKKYLDENEAAASGVTPDEFKKMLDELFLLNGVLNIGDYIPWLSFLDLQGYVGRMKTLSKKLSGFLDHVLEEHNEHRRVAGEKFVAKDMVDVLLQLADDPNLDIELDKNSVKAFTQDLIAGGTESSAVTVEWALSEMLKQPHLFDKAWEELDRVIGQNRWVQEKDVAHLPFIDAIMKETMRLHPVAPMLVPRMAREDCQINGYDVLAGTQVFVNVWSIGRDAGVWGDPDVFRPERFVGKEMDIKGQDFELLPFGSGRRMCPGYSLGTKVIQLTLANLLHGFRWKLPTEVTAEELSMEEIWGLSTPRKFPLVTVPHPRLPAQVYRLNFA